MPIPNIAAVKAPFQVASNPPVIALSNVSPTLTPNVFSGSLHILLTLSLIPLRSLKAHIPNPNLPAKPATAVGLAKLLRKLPAAAPAPPNIPLILSNILENNPGFFFSLSPIAPSTPSAVASVF